MPADCSKWTVVKQPKIAPLRGLYDPIYLRRAVSSVVEHYLDTVGVRGSKPLPRTITRNSIGHFMRRLFFQCLLWLLIAAFSQAQGSSSQTDATGIMFTSISGPVRNAVVYAPNPVIPPAAIQQHLGGHGVYKIDLDNGIPYDVRVVRSAGYKILDDAAVEALRTWRFRPHRLVWATIPIDFEPTNRQTGTTH